MEPVQKSRRERWTAEAVKALQKAVETHLRGDNDVNWAGVARELGTTADRVKKKWRKLQKNDNTGAVSEPHASGSHAKIPYAKLPLSYPKRFTNSNLDNSGLLQYFNTRWKDPNPTSAELARFVNEARSLGKVLKWFCAARAVCR